MAVTEKHRHELFNEVERVLGERHAETLMELLPPVGWADVATKHDLDAQRAASKQDLELVRTDLKSDIDRLRVETKRDLELVRTELKSDIDLVRTELKSDIDLVRTEMATKSDLNGLRREMVGWLLTTVGIQTATIGLLVTFSG